MITPKIYLMCGTQYNEIFDLPNFTGNTATIINSNSYQQQILAR